MAPGRKRLTTYIFSLLKDGYKRHQIENYLIEHNHSRHFVKEIVAETVKMHRSMIIMKLLVLLLAGTIICLFCTLFTTMPAYMESSIP